MFSKCLQVIFLSLLALAQVACSHQDRKKRERTSDVHFMIKLEQLLEKTDDLERFQMQKVSFQRR